MAQTITAATGIDSEVYLDDAGGNLTNISGSSSKLDLSPENKVGEMQTFGSRWMIRTVGGKNLQVKVTSVLSIGADEATEIILDWWNGGSDAPRTARFDFPNSEVGSYRLEGEFVLADLPFVLDSGDANPAKLEYTLMNTGAVSYERITS